jgi:hypothetical protein
VAAGWCTEAAVVAVLLVRLQEKKDVLEEGEGSDGDKSCALAPVILSVVAGAEGKNREEKEKACVRLTRSEADDAAAEAANCTCVVLITGGEGGVSGEVEDPGTTGCRRDTKSCWTCGRRMR